MTPVELALRLPFIDGSTWDEISRRAARNRKASEKLGAGLGSVETPHVNNASFSRISTQEPIGTRSNDANSFFARSDPRLLAVLMAAVTWWRRAQNLGCRARCSP